MRPSRLLRKLAARRRALVDNFHQRGELRGPEPGRGGTTGSPGLNLMAAIIIYWNTLKLGDAVFAKKQAGREAAVDNGPGLSQAGSGVDDGEVRCFRPGSR